MEDVRKLIQTRKLGVNEMSIKEAEEKLGAIFPVQYKELFKLVNNAEIGDWILYPIKDQQNPKKTWDDVVRQNTEVREEFMPKELITIGEDGSGDKLCFIVNQGIMGDAIYLWSHEDATHEKYASTLKEFIVSASEEENDDDYEDE
ncbi:SMI1/KNR4 family protein [Cytobacillus gottheilii]|uniref:SMI1/KNR4 family protein n=1 Tax=Cytobacillus gottheilii TaxID=859144 RepID=A0ABX8FHH5_9BACI|nr:SMI1/KNR4 family protein [Cytobacillus gottheilii]QVY63463.1 SMI1/KNR4 family protein [Cytobacillus gottheilii]